MKPLRMALGRYPVTMDLNPGLPQYLKRIEDQQRATQVFN